jgi:hypothetical protein
MVELDRAGIPIDFGIKYLKNVVLEFGVLLRVRKKFGLRTHPKRYVSTVRDGVPHLLPETPPVAESEVTAVLDKLGRLAFSKNA